MSDFIRGDNITNSDVKWYKSGGEQSKYQEICDLADIVKMHRWNYTNNKIMYDTVSVCLKDDKNLSEDLKVKIQNILCAHEVEPCMNLSSNNVNLNLLGLSQINPKDTSLLYEEHRKLKETFEDALIRLSNEMQDLFKPEASPENTGLLKSSTEDKVLLDSKNKVAQAQGLYIKNLFDYYKILEEILQLRMNDMRKMSELKVKECSFELQKYIAQSEILMKSSRVNIFTETSHTLNAYGTLMADILKEQASCEEEIEKLRVLKEQYKQVACKQYDEILKDYISYKRDLEMKRMIFKDIKN